MSTYRRGTPFVLAGCLFAACTASAEPALPYAYLSPGLASGGSPAARSGHSVAHNARWLVVGAPGYDDHDATGAGVVAVYAWRDGEWRSLLSLTLRRLEGGVTEQSGARFGASVALAGDRVLIGCPGCESPRPKAYLVELTDPLTLPPTWYPLHPALISAPDAESGIGAAVAMSGNTIAVSAPNARSTSQGVERGAVALGHFDGTQVAWDDIVFGPASPAGSRFGHSLAMTTSSGDSPFDSVRSLVVGAPAYVDSGGFGLAGRAYLFEQDGILPGPWDLVQEFGNPTSGLADALGWSVAIDRPSTQERGHIALGAPGRSVDGTPGGGVHVYSRGMFDDDYLLEDVIQHPQAEVGDRFGIAVGIDDSRVLVGADRRHVDAGVDQGAAYLFERLASSSDVEWPWLQTLEFVGSGNVAFGQALSMTRGMAVIGMPDFGGGRGAVGAYVCDQIFAYAMEDDASACTTP